MGPLAFLREFCAFIRARKKYWLAPAIILAFVVGGLLVLAQSSAVAPLIYTVF